VSEIVIENVRAAPSELRPAATGWESATRWNQAPLLIQFAGLFSLVILIAASPSPDGIKAAALGIGLATLFGWFGVCQWLAAHQIKVHRSTPSGSQASTYTLDRQGVGVRNGHAESRMDWSGLKGVVRDHDRYVFLFTPAYNPVLPRRLLTPEQDASVQALIVEVGLMVTDGPPPGVD
jgi:hypothetical protein